ncbi:hypothetical protein PoB_005062800 [Plakobranchus ocellatus]|uniref:Uncharacterized protein n=1 Tax=Plakobranchus ocellatus TaxID=259542 RepID=A0AAV4BY17_9GAST|nr:hypothetical protein PoB_005062800 [Plakobranchus ocellatus]
MTQASGYFMSTPPIHNKLTSGRQGLLHVRVSNSRYKIFVDLRAESSATVPPTPKRRSTTNEITIRYAKNVFHNRH